MHWESYPGSIFSNFEFRRNCFFFNFLRFAVWVHIHLTHRRRPYRRFQIWLTFRSEPFHCWQRALQISRMPSIKPYRARMLRTSISWNQKKERASTAKLQSLAIQWEPYWLMMHSVDHRNMVDMAARLRIWTTIISATAYCLTQNWTQRNYWQRRRHVVGHRRPATHEYRASISKSVTFSCSAAHWLLCWPHDVWSIAKRAAWSPTAARCTIYFIRPIRLHREWNRCSVHGSPCCHRWMFHAMPNTLWAMVNRTICVSVMRTT